jgi:hypothetical protein
MYTESVFNDFSTKIYCDDDDDDDDDDNNNDTDDIDGN